MKTFWFIDPVTNIIGRFIVLPDDESSSQNVAKRKYT